MLQLSVDIGRRVLVIANLLLGPTADRASDGAATGLARALDDWAGPGIVVVAGNLFDLGGRCRSGLAAAGGLRSVGDPTEAGDPTEDAAARAAAALDAHPRLQSALARFAGGEDRKVVVLPGAADWVLATDRGAAAVLGELGVQVAGSLELQLETATGRRVVRVESGSEIGPAVDGGPSGGAPVVVAPDPAAPWQAGIDRLAEPACVQRFLTSRLLYRRLARYAWWLVVPFAAAVLLRLSVPMGLVDRLFAHRVGLHGALHRAQIAAWDTRLLVAGVIAGAELLLLAVVLGFLSRQAWKTFGGGRLSDRSEEHRATMGATANDVARDTARTAIGEGCAGLISGATLQAELTHLSPGFFASCGTAGEVVEEHPGRLGLPPVFLHHRQVAWVELETGAELHARLLLARSDVAPETLLERLAVRHRLEHQLHPAVVAAHPRGGSWPPAPDLASLRRRSRRYRRWGAAAIALAGVIDILDAVTPPLRGRLRLLLDLIPLGASQLAGALVAVSGIGLLVLARGIRRGQHRAWVVATGLLAASFVLHVVQGVDLEEAALTAVVLGFLVVHRGEFRAASDRPSLRSAIVAFVAGTVGVTVASGVLIDIVDHIHRRSSYLSLWSSLQAAAERLAGIKTVPLPDRIDDFVSPSLLAIGLTLAAAAVVLATRPVVDRRLSSGRAAEGRARDIVRRHGAGTLDYFALRSDKRWFFHRDSLVAYAVYGGICLVSPDPIGPVAEREQVWEVFRRFVDGHGWAVAIMGAAEDWLPVYRATGMHDIYIGDEAVVDVQEFSLQGGHMKGLRQAHNRIAKYGYAASFHDPARLDRGTARELTGLMSQSRRGEFERGFSMMLGRIFDPRDEDLLLCVVKGPDGAPAAMCQFVPSPAIEGYSLDLMRRDRGEHPNGLIDFALVSTIEHLRALGKQGLSLNFAALRSILEGERGDGLTQRAERWLLRQMSRFAQIETLWRFNAKYQPDWLPRYVVYDTAEHLAPVVLAILRAESLWEVPIIGRVIAAGDRRNRGADDGADAASGATLLPAAHDDEGRDDEGRDDVRRPGKSTGLSQRPSRRTTGASEAARAR